MTFLLTFVATLIGGAAGFAAGAAIGAAAAGIFGMSNFEGAAGYFVIFLCGPLGALIGMIGGAVWMLWRRGVRSFGAIAGRFVLIVAGIAAITGGGLYLAYELRDHVNPNGAAPQLAFEVRLPPGMAPPTDRHATFQLHTSKNRMPGFLDEAPPRREDDRAVISGFVEMYFRTSQRVLVMTLPDKTDVLFQIRLSGVPKHSKDFGPWQRVDHITRPGSEQAVRPGPADAYEIRYRAVWAGED